MYSVTFILILNQTTLFFLTSMYFSELLVVIYIDSGIELHNIFFGAILVESA